MVWEMAAGPFSDLSPEPWLISKRGKPEFANNSTTDKRQRQKGTSWNESYHTPLHVGNILFQVVVVVVDTSCQAAGKGRKNPISPQALSNNLYQSVVDAAAAGTAGWDEVRKFGKWHYWKTKRRGAAAVVKELTKRKPSMGQRLRDFLAIHSANKTSLKMPYIFPYLS